MQRKLKYLILGMLFLVLPVLAKNQPQVPSVAPITIKSLHDIAIYPENSIPAEVISLQKSTISAEISGGITDINVQVGTEVENNSIIAKIECADYKANSSRISANIAAIKADIELTKWQLARSKRLAQQSNISQERVQQLDASLAKLEAKHDAESQSLISAEKNVNRCNIVAPYSGLIVSKYINKGEFVTPGTKIVQLVNNNEVELDAKVHNKEIQQIQTANQDNLLFFKLYDREYPVKIRTIVSNEDPKTKSQTIRFVFIAEKPIPGSSGKLLWRSLQPQIPPEFVQNINDTFGIFIIKDNVASFYKLTNAIEGRHVEIDKGFHYPIIVEGRYSVKDGQEIRILNQ